MPDISQINLNKLPDWDKNRISLWVKAGREEKSSMYKKEVVAVRNSDISWIIQINYLIRIKIVFPCGSRPGAKKR